MDNIEQRKLYKGIKKWTQGNKISAILALGKWGKSEQRAQPHAENWYNGTAQVAPKTGSKARSLLWNWHLVT